VSLADALEGSGFDPQRRTLYLIEGLVYYLPPRAFESLLGAISSTAALGSRLYFDFIHLSAMSGARRAVCGLRLRRLEGEGGLARDISARLRRAAALTRCGLFTLPTCPPHNHNHHPLPPCLY
jgi:O-methyltransferase involved in polyketide biosynthesis